jgi:hypothetical protein
MTAGNWVQSSDPAFKSEGLKHSALASVLENLESFERDRGLTGAVIRQISKSSGAFLDDIRKVTVTTEMGTLKWFLDSSSRLSETVGPVEGLEPSKADPSSLFHVRRHECNGRVWR